MTLTGPMNLVPFLVHGQPSRALQATREYAPGDIIATDCNGCSELNRCFEGQCPGWYAVAHSHEQENVKYANQQQRATRSIKKGDSLYSLSQRSSPIEPAFINKRLNNAVTEHLRGQLRRLSNAPSDIPYKWALTVHAGTLRDPHEITLTPH